MTDLAAARAYPHRVPNRAAWHLLAAAELRPLGDRVLVQPDPPAERWESGLWIPQTAADDNRPQTGTVLAVGPDVRDVAAGDRLLFRQWGGTEVQVGGDDVLLLPARDVFAVIEEAA